MNNKHICFCADGNYVGFIPSVIESIVRNNLDSFVFHVISNEPLSTNFKSNLMAVPGEVDLIWHTVNDSQFDGLKEVAHFTKAMYYRLLIPELIDSDKVLYLDCDVLVRGDISGLFSIDFEGEFLGAVENPFFGRAEKLGMRKSDGYFNSGVMLINTREWKRNKIKDLVIGLVRDKADVLEMPDQDALNLVFSGSWLKLDSKYNAQMAMFAGSKSLLGSNYFNSGILDPVIVHFSASNKQWHYSCPLSYAQEYRALRTARMVPKRFILLDRLIGWCYLIKYKVLDWNRYM